MRTYAFLQCGGCRHFHPKSTGYRMAPEASAAFQTAAFVGLCTAFGQPEWLVWKSVEAAASEANTCSLREPLASDTPRCPLHDFTPESGARRYPESCVYYPRPSCPYTRREPS